MVSWSLELFYFFYIQLVCDLFPALYHFMWFHSRLYRLSGRLSCCIASYTWEILRIWPICCRTRFLVYTRVMTEMLLNRKSIAELLDSDIPNIEVSFR